MQHEAFEPLRTAEGAIDIRHYAKQAASERQATKTDALRRIARGSRRVILALVAFIAFWNVPPMGSAGSREIPYR